VTLRLLGEYSPKLRNKLFYNYPKDYSFEYKAPQRAYMASLNMREQYDLVAYHEAELAAWEAYNRK
jgi:hypothetical protein